jgi:hypothetical protein
VVAVLEFVALGVASAGGLLVGALLGKYQHNSGDDGGDDGCDGHHFGVYEDKDAHRVDTEVEFRVVDPTRAAKEVGTNRERVLPYRTWTARAQNDTSMMLHASLRGDRAIEDRKRVVLEQKTVATCEHDGCTATDVVWRPCDSVAIEDGSFVTGDGDA